jgi:hypothetical protein
LGKYFFRNHLNAQIIGNNLFLNYTPELVGTANITIQETSNKLTVNNTFSVTLNPFNGTINTGRLLQIQLLPAGMLPAGTEASY